MKVINLGETMSLGMYDDLKLQKAKKLNKFGAVYYLKDRIYLVHSKFVNDYSLYNGSDRSGPSLSVPLTPELKAELMKIMGKMKKQEPEIEFKPLDAD